MTELLSRLSLRTGGESHGPGVTVLLEGLPRGLPLDVAAVDAQLVRRQGGAGRSGRQKLEQDRIRVLGGVRHGVLLGSPLVLFVENRDATIETLPDPVRPRPGHVDLAACYRYLDHDIRASLERASARETAGRVAGGAVCQQLLGRLGVEVFGFVRAIGRSALGDAVPGEIRRADLEGLRELCAQSHLGTLDTAVDAAMLEEVRSAGKAGDTLGGVVEVQALGMLPGAGSHLQWNERLDARLAAALMSIQAIKGVEVGLGFAAARQLGSAVHDPILPPGADGLPVRATNRAGGIEGGISNGQNVVVRAAMKPLATLREPLASIDVRTGSADQAGYERSDVCAVASASVVAEAMVALVLADALLARLGGETLEELEQRAGATWARLRSLVPRARG
jgi:chorismate synthase